MHACSRTSDTELERRREERAHDRGREESASESQNNCDTQSNRSRAPICLLVRRSLRRRASAVCCAVQWCGVRTLGLIDVLPRVGATEHIVHLLSLEVHSLRDRFFDGVHVWACLAEESESLRSAVRHEQNVRARRTEVHGGARGPNGEKETEERCKEEEECNRCAVATVDSCGVSCRVSRCAAEPGRSRGEARAAHCHYD